MAVHIPYIYRHCQLITSLILSCSVQPLVLISRGLPFYISKRVAQTHTDIVDVSLDEEDGSIHVWLQELLF